MKFLVLSDLHVEFGSHITDLIDIDADYDAILMGPVILEHVEKT